MGEKIGDPGRVIGVAVRPGTFRMCEALARIRLKAWQSTGQTGFQ